MILKILLIVAVIGVVYFIYMKKKSALQNSNKEDKKKQSNEMVECSTCGIYSELGDAILSGSKYYCSKKCLEAAK